MGRYAQAARRGVTRGKPAPLAPPVPVLTTYQMDCIVTFNWTVQASTRLRFYTSDDQVNYVHARDEWVSQDEGGYSTNYYTEGWDGYYVRVEIYGDGIQYPADQFSTSAGILLPSE